MKILVDMNLSPGWVGFFAAHGIEAVHWSNAGDPRARDSEIMAWARQHGHIVFTHDLDFAAGSSLIAGRWAMEGGIDRHQRWIPALRWTARVWSVASVALVLAFIVGEGFNPSGLNEWLLILFFPIGISVGMILAWWKEGLGGSITVGSLLAFYLVHLTTAGTFPKGWAWLAFAAPGFLFVLSSRLSRRSRIAAA